MLPVFLPCSQEAIERALKNQYSVSEKYMFQEFRQVLLKSSLIIFHFFMNGVLHAATDNSYHVSTRTGYVSVEREFVGGVVLRRQFYER